MNEELLDRYADLIVGFGANVQPDQVVAVEAPPEAAPLVHRIARRAYEHGARFVDVVYFDPLVKRLRVELAADDTLSWVPPWLGRRVLDLGELDAARIRLSPTVPPGLLAGLDPRRAARDQLPAVREVLKTVEDRPSPGRSRRSRRKGGPRSCSPSWSRLPRSRRSGGTSSMSAGSTSPIRSTLAAAAQGDLGGSVPCRRARPRRREVRRARDRPHGRSPSQLALREGRRQLDHAHRRPACAESPHRGALHHTGSRAYGGLRHVDQAARRRRLARDRAADSLRGRSRRRDRRRRECGDTPRALRGRRGRRAPRRGRARRRQDRIGRLGRTFFSTLLDENSASHLALGDAYSHPIADPADLPRINHSEEHIDFMIGSDEVTVSGVTRAGDEFRLLVGGAWQI